MKTVEKIGKGRWGPGVVRLVLGLALGLILALVARPERAGRVYAASGGFTTAGIHFTDAGDGFLVGTTHVDGSQRSGFRSNHMLVRYYSEAGQEVGNRMIPLASDHYDLGAGQNTIAVMKDDVVRDAPQGTVRACLDQCVILLNGSGRGNYFAYGSVGLTERELMQFDRTNDGSLYMSAEELNVILGKVHRLVPNWCPDGHRYEVFGYQIDLPAAAYQAGGQVKKDMVTLSVIAGQGIRETYGSGEYERGALAHYGGSPESFYNAPAEEAVLMTESKTVTVTGIPWSHQVNFDPNGGSGVREAFRHTYGGGNEEIPAGPVREGYTFAGWRLVAGEMYDKDETGETSGTRVPYGEVLLPGSKYSYEQNGGSVLLQALWKVNTYTLVYHANNGSADEREVGVQWADLDASAIGTTSGKVYPSRGGEGAHAMGFSAPASQTEEGAIQTFTGWDMDGQALKPRKAAEDISFGIEMSRHENQGGKVFYRSLVRAAGLASQPESRIHLYAVWDDLPSFRKADRLYFSSRQAEAGIEAADLVMALTERDEKTLRISDPEDGQAFHFEETLSNADAVENAGQDDAGRCMPWGMLPADSVFVADYDTKKFLGMGERGAASVRFVVVDWAGNYQTITREVWITASDVRADKTYVRMIDQENYRKNDPSANSGKNPGRQSKHGHEKGGLEDRSVWYQKTDYRKLIENCLERMQGSS